MARRFLTPTESARVRLAVREAERGNRGEVRVHLERRCFGDPLRRAQKHFHRLGVDRTAEATGVLLYVAVDSHRAAVVADRGVHGPGGELWSQALDLVVAGFRAGEGADGLERALGLIGDTLRTLVPGVDSAGNELPDAPSGS